MQEMSLNLIKLRKLTRWSQEDLSERSGITIRTIQRVESGATTPRAYTVNTLAKVFEISIEQLFESDKASVADNASEFDKIRRINTAALLVLVLPFGNLIATVLLSKRYKDSTLVSKVGQQIISFHLIWSIATIVLLALTPPITKILTGSMAVGKFPLFFVLYSIMLLINLGFVIKAAIKLSTGNSDIFNFVPKLI
jgi:transcriptional regulator with XRE-family HTH domain